MRNDNVNKSPTVHGYVNKSSPILGKWKCFLTRFRDLDQNTERTIDRIQKDPNHKIWKRQETEKMNIYLT